MGSEEIGVDWALMFSTGQLVECREFVGRGGACDRCGVLWGDHIGYRPADEDAPDREEQER